MKSGRAVYEKHFLENQIMRKREFFDTNGRVVQLNVFINIGWGLEWVMTSHEIEGSKLVILLIHKNIKKD